VAFERLLGDVLPGIGTPAFWARSSTAAAANDMLRSTDSK
jgi:hypothetical protein